MGITTKCLEIKMRALAEIDGELILTEQIKAEMAV